MVGQKGRGGAGTAAVIAAAAGVVGAEAGSATTFRLGVTAAGGGHRPLYSASSSYWSRHRLSKNAAYLHRQKPTFSAGFAVAGGSTSRPSSSRRSSVTEAVARDTLRGAGGVSMWGRLGGETGGVLVSRPGCLKCRDDDNGAAAAAATWVSRLGGRHGGAVRGGWGGARWESAVGSLSGGGDASFRRGYSSQVCFLIFVAFCFFFVRFLSLSVI